MLSVLLSTRIRADIAVAAARELFDAGCGTPRGMLKASWQERVELRPYLDRKALDGAKRLKLPSDPKRLAGLVGADELAPLAAALVRVALDAKLAKQISA